MGREIRRVPADWQHPRYEDERNAGEYRPLYDQTFEDAATEWCAGFDAWRNGIHKDQITHPELTVGRRFWQWHGNPPDEDSYRPAFASEPTHYQIYETVSEGTPVSPVFVTLDAMVDWLVSQGTARKSAEAFAKSGWAPSMTVMHTSGHVDIRLNYDALLDVKSA